MNARATFGVVLGAILTAGTWGAAQTPPPGLDAPMPDGAPYVHGGAGVFGFAGATDRFGMPLDPSFIGPPWVFAAPGSEFSAEPALINPPTQPIRRRVAPAARRNNAAKARSDRGDRTRTSQPAGPVARYRLPHGSLDWEPGPPMLSTSPANPYGYGYGDSGYGTEVFGDFWKGWPIVGY